MRIKRIKQGQSFQVIEKWSIHLHKSRFLKFSDSAGNCQCKKKEAWQVRCRDRVIVIGNCYQL